MAPARRPSSTSSPACTRRPPAACYLDGEDITGLPPHQLFARGVLRTFQIAHEFSTLTVRENLMTVPAGQSGERLPNVWLRPRKIRAEEAALRAKADEVIEFLKLDAVAASWPATCRAARRSWSSSAAP